MTDPTKGVVILGGSFNPPHTGHFRLAIELYEAFSEEISEIVLLPCAIPPHKETRTPLPFDLRCQMLEACIGDFPWLSVSRMEGERKTPSYTWETLREWSRRYPEKKLYFALGSDDYTDLSQWFRGLEIPKLCTLIVFPRGNFTKNDFIAVSQNFWGDCEEETQDGCFVVRFQSDLRSVFFTAPWLPISATDIRRRWKENRSLSYLLPDECLRLVKENKEIVQMAWGRS